MEETIEAWAIERGGRNELVKRNLRVRQPSSAHALVEPLFTAWEANMSHAIERKPIDLCEARNEEHVVVGNAGIVRVLRAADTGPKEGEICLMVDGGVIDDLGYCRQIFGFDMPGSIGFLAKRTFVRGQGLVPVTHSKWGVERWASYAVRYISAWSNWRVALGALRLQVSEQERPTPHVFGWGGGTTLAELDLARRFGANAVMFSGNRARLDEIERVGVRAVDRNAFGSLLFDAKKFAIDPEYKKAYLTSEKAFLKCVADTTQNGGVDIFVDFLGGDLGRVTQKALARQGVITTAGWKLGTMSYLNRAQECIGRHIHVHTHYARANETLEAVKFSEETGWLAPPSPYVRGWDQVNEVHQDYIQGKIPTHFPLVRVGQ